MKTRINYQVWNPDSGRPIDNGDAVEIGTPGDDETPRSVPSKGDFVHIDSSVVGGEVISGVVRSVLYTYIVTEHDTMCGINVVVDEQADIPWGELIKE